MNKLDSIIIDGDIETTGIVKADKAVNIPDWKTAEDYKIGDKFYSDDILLRTLSNHTSTDIPSDASNLHVVGYENIIADHPIYGNTFDEVQAKAAIDDAVSKGIDKVVFNKDYNFDIGIDLPSNIEIEVNGNITLKQAQSYNLASDSGTMTSNTKVTFTGTYNRTDNRDYTLLDATGLKVGQIVCFYDDLFPKQFLPHTNRKGLVAEITDINGNVVTIDRDFTDWLTSTPIGSDLFLVAQNARLVNVDYLFRIDNKDNVTISGTGSLDGNKPNDPGILDVANDPNVQPVNDEWNEEDFTFGAGCVIAILNNSSNIDIKGGEVKNGLLHNFRIREVENFNITNIDIHNAHDKNLLIHYTRDGLIRDNEVHDSLFEDGIISYIDNYHLIIDNNNVYGNPRFGIGIQNRCFGVRTSNNTMSFNGISYFANSEQGLQSTNDYIVGGQMRTFRTTEKFVLKDSLRITGRNIIFNNLKIYYPYEESTITFPEASDWTPIRIYDRVGSDIGVSKNIVFNGGDVVNSWARPRNTTTMAWEGSPQNSGNHVIVFGGAENGQDKVIDGVSFNNFNFEGVSRGFVFNRPVDQGLQFSRIRFNQCIFKDSFYSMLFDFDVETNDKNAVTFTNSDDYITDNYIPGVVLDGQFLTGTTDWNFNTASGNTYNAAEERAEWDGTAGVVLMTQNNVLTIGKTYLVTYRVNNLGGSIYPRMGFSGDGTPRGIVGTFVYTEEIVCSGSTQISFFGNGFQGWVDDVSAIQLD